jgi:hypothetical protein
MTQWKFCELTDLCYLFAAPANVVISHIGQVCLFIFSFDRVTSVEMQMGKEVWVKIMAFTVVDHRVLGYYTILCWIGLNDLELDGSHATAD